ncbi:MAG: hypothetical protein VKO21_11385 [Candidatus Sericytochromatia bacterium]|nr:hypothetical protein [Candidatus Sericytochromatia bacterium]
MPCPTELEGAWLVRAKLNLGLAVGPPDGVGYHSISTLLVAIDAADELHVAPVSGPACWEVVWAKGAPATDLGDLTSNLAWRAWREAGAEEGWSFRLVKHLPAGGGLGAGSANAAAVLRLLSMAHGVSPLAGIEVARRLGSDVAFFLGEEAAWGTGRGDVLQVLPPGPVLHGVLACGHARVPTAEAYRWLDQVPDRATANLVRLRTAWELGEGAAVLDALTNDFAEVVSRRAPEVAEAAGALRRAGARSVLLAGSGATWAGFADSEADARRLLGAMGDFKGWVRLFRTERSPFQRMT